MNGTSGTESPAKPQGERLALRRGKMAFIWQLCFVLLMSVSSLYLLLHGSKTSAVFSCLGAMLSAVSLPKFWRQYRLVKSGAIVTVQPQVTAQLVRVHPAAAIVVTSLMTLMVLIMSAGTMYTFPLMSAPFGFRVFLVGFNAFLWLLT